jgi:hypothetical protein
MDASFIASIRVVPPVSGPLLGMEMGGFYFAAKQADFMSEEEGTHAALNIFLIYADIYI